MDKKKISQELENFQETSVLNEYVNYSITIILLRPENSGNVGSIARIMKNFDFSNLVIINPIEKEKNIFSYETQGYAMHGKDILLNAKILNPLPQTSHVEFVEKSLKSFDLVIGTTAKGKKYNNINRISIFPRELDLPISHKKKYNVAILFGKESRGLTNKELDYCDILLRIPTGNEYPTLNLSHACGIILYELFKKIHTIKHGRGQSPVLLADKKERILLYKIIKKLIKKLKIRNYKKGNVLKAFKNVLERAFITKKELSLILGLFSKTYNLIKDLDLFDES
ncbi:MAG: TrmJ/YjtD family RNA methyltransferase [Promethearchaeota archaeon]|nr:MAG: TrmJ/YjtD family RNA methyltransferase [Candidatus Lokiarchaeota archaeon]